MMRFFGPYPVVVCECVHIFINQQLRVCLPSDWMHNLQVQKETCKLYLVVKTIFPPLKYNMILSHDFTLTSISKGQLQLFLSIVAWSQLTNGIWITQVPLIKLISTLFHLTGTWRMVFRKSFKWLSIMLKEVLQMKHFVIQKISLW